MTSCWLLQGYQTEIGEHGTDSEPSYSSTRNRAPTGTHAPEVRSYVKGRGLPSDFSGLPVRCEYERNRLYLMQAQDIEFTKQFNNGFREEDDIIFDVKNHRNYFLYWSKAPVGTCNGDEGQAIGATRGVVVSVKTPDPNLGLMPRCVINWVPTGHYQLRKCLSTYKGCCTKWVPKSSTGH